MEGRPQDLLFLTLTQCSHFQCALLTESDVMHRYERGQRVAQGGALVQRHVALPQDIANKEGKGLLVRLSQDLSSHPKGTMTLSALRSPVLTLTRLHSALVMASSAGLCACVEAFLACAGAPVRSRQGGPIPVTHPWADNKPEQLCVVRW